MKRKQFGVALITILLLIAVLTAIVSRLSLSNEVWIRQMDSGTAFTQARQAARAAQYWTLKLLEQDNNEVDALTDSWAQVMPALPVSWGVLDGWVEDMQGRFNLNNLVNEKGEANTIAIENFERLLQILELNTGIAQATVDWIDADELTAGPWGAEDGYYLGLSPAYLAANRPFDEVAELRLVRGVTMDAWIKLSPHITALPHGTEVNVNTASPEVLAAIVTNWGAAYNALGKAKNWTRRATLNPAVDLEQFTKEVLSGGEDAVPQGLGVSTEYFMGHIRLSFGQVDYQMATLYRREKGRADIIWHAREFL